MQFIEMYLTQGFILLKMTGSTNGAECKYNVKIHVLHKRLSLPFIVLARYCKTKNRLLILKRNIKVTQC